MDAFKDGSPMDAENGAGREADGNGNNAKSRYTTISIPQPLYHEVKQAIEGTGFRSPTEFLVYVTRLSLQSPLVRDEARTRGPPFFSAPR